MSRGSTSTPASGGTNSGGPPTRVATTDLPEAIAFQQRLAERLDEGRLAEDGRLGDVARHLVVRDSARDLDVRPALELRAERAVADENEAPAVERRERIREPHDVLPLDQAPDADENRAICSTCPVPGTGYGLALEEREVDAAVDDFRLAAGFGDLRLELAAEVVGDGDQRRGSAGHEAGRGPDPWIGADVADVLAVGRGDERGAAEERSREARRDEEVCVDDVCLGRPSHGHVPGADAVASRRRAPR